eukprot:4565414-Prymnesium_polylepis.1
MACMMSLGSSQRCAGSRPASTYASSCTRASLVRPSTSRHDAPIPAASHRSSSLDATSRAARASSSAASGPPSSAASPIAIRMPQRSRCCRNCRARSVIAEPTCSAATFGSRVPRMARTTCASARSAPSPLPLAIRFAAFTSAVCPPAKHRTCSTSMICAAESWQSSALAAARIASIGADAGMPRAPERSSSM